MQIPPVPSTAPGVASSTGWSELLPLVRDLGSTLDLPTLGGHAASILLQHFGLEDARICLVDGAERRVECVDPTVPDRSASEQRGGLDDAFASRLRRGELFVDVCAGDLPAAADLERPTLALRLLDGEDVVGIAAVERSRLLELVREGHADRLKTTAGLIGSALARGLVHETMLGLTSRLETAQRLQQHILDHVSHEFNTPLMILKSTAQFADTDDAEERAAFLDMHAQAVVRLEELVQGMLEVARTRSTGSVQRLGTAEIRRALLEPALEVEGRWGELLRQSWFELPSDLSLRVDADGLGLTLEHLLRNAWQYGGADGASVLLAAYVDDRRRWRRGDPSTRIEIALEALRARDAARLVPTGSGSELLVLEVVDSGIGIPSDELLDVFEPFNQASNSPLRTVSGAGMGLPTCRSRIEAMGGELRLDSALGRGTRATVLLPIRSRA